jgi:glycosyltransferase involved in cell wall biosynthesis
LPTPAIAFDVTPLQNAHRFRGIGTYVRGLAQHLAQQSEIPIEFWAWDSPGVFRPPAPHRIVKLPRFAMPEYRGTWIFAQIAMYRWARRSNARVIHVTDPNALRAIPRRRMLTTVYDLIPLKQGFRRRSVLNRLGYSRYLHALRSADTLFAISDQTARDLTELLAIPPQRVVVVRPGIEVTAPMSNAAPGARPFFLFVGGPNPNKNLTVLLDAMSRASVGSEELLIVGRWLPPQLDALAIDLEQRGLRERVRHLGYVPDAELFGLMRAATALVVPSLEEGFGLPVGEGLAAGAVVIHSRIGILEEVSQGAALTFDPRKPAELAARLDEAASNTHLREELRHRGIARATELSWDDALKATLTAYRAAVAQVK